MTNLGSSTAGVIQALLHSNSHCSTKIVWRYWQHNFKNSCSFRCDATSKVGTKAAALKAYCYLWISFRQNRKSSFLALKNLKNTFVLFFTQKKIAINLRYFLHTKKNKMLWCLPSTSNMSHGHSRRSYYFNLFKSDIDTRLLFESCGIWLEFSRLSIDKNTPLHYQRCTLDARKTALEDVSAAS